MQYLFSSLCFTAAWHNPFLTMVSCWSQGLPGDGPTCSSFWYSWNRRPYSSWSSTWSLVVVAFTNLGSLDSQVDIVVIVMMILLLYFQKVTYLVW